MCSIFQEHYYFIVDHLSQGGVLMIPLISLSLAMCTLIINKTLYFRRLYQNTMTRGQAGECIQSGVYQNTKGHKDARSILVENYLARRSGNPSIDKNIMDETVIVLKTSLDNYLPLIGALAGIAPLLGLLGTVTGMIDVFDIMSRFGTENAEGMAGEISEALITTQTGLFIAIPGLYMNHFLIRRSDNLKHRIASMGMYLKRYI